MAIAQQEVSGVNVPEIAKSMGQSILISRWLGAWVDFIVVGGTLFGADTFLGNDLYQKTLGFWLGLPVVYFVVLEWRFGRTLGKLLTGTIVVNEQGGRPSFGQSVIRTLLRIVEVNPLLFGGVPAGIIALLTPCKQRLGDIFAKTYVVRAKELPPR